MRLWILAGPLLALAMSPTASAQEGLALRVRELLGAPPNLRPAALEKLLADEPSVAAFVKAAETARSRRAAELEAGWSLAEAQDEAGVLRPYQLFLPDALREEADGLPLLVCLHGAVGRAEFSRTLGRVGSTGSAWSRAAAKRGFPVVYPLGRRDCTWWSEAGVRAIRAAVRDVQRRLPIDPRRIVVSGFSDGGSGSYFLAMRAPDLFAAFIPLNGHPRVAASASGMSLHLRNLLQTSLFAAMTRDDVLYPARDVLPHLQPLLARDADIHLVTYPFGNHTPAYFAEQEEALCRYFLEARKTVWPRQIDWSHTGEAPGGTAWLRITGTGRSPLDAPDRDDLNVMSTPGRIRLGVRLATDTARPTIASVTPDSLAADLRLQPGDVLERLDDTPLADTLALRGALGRKRHGDSLLLGVRRGESSLSLFGRIPPFTPQPIYRRDGPTAWVRATLDADHRELRLVSHGVTALGLRLPEPLLPNRGRGPNAVALPLTTRALTLREIATRWSRVPSPRSLATYEAKITLR